MRVTRRPRCSAEDIAADAHPARVLNSGVDTRWYVCRGCYRPTEWDDPHMLLDEPERSSPSAPIRAALADVARRLAIGALP